MEEIRDKLLQLGFKNNAGSCYYEYEGKGCKGDEFLRIGIHIHNFNCYSFSARRFVYIYSIKMTLERCVMIVSKDELKALMMHFHLDIE